ncbi:hypothetical protein [Halosegnis marinus]|uniref:hypothetical protein n=1 Tax=Halosegnis marinus TaxID=3034023 RepID=UPI003622D006
MPQAVLAGAAVRVADHPVGLGDVGREAVVVEVVADRLGVVPLVGQVGHRPAAHYVVVGVVPRLGADAGDGLGVVGGRGANVHVAGCGRAPKEAFAPTGQTSL